MGGACSMNGRKERCIQGFGGGPEERGHLEDLKVNGRTI
jgi:hypothetical protein